VQYWKLKYDHNYYKCLKLVGKVRAAK
jgi:hypothetical protein